MEFVDFGIQNYVLCRKKETNIDFHLRVELGYCLALSIKLANNVVCKIPLLARRTRPKQPAGQARHATIGYLVYNQQGCLVFHDFVC